MGTKQLGLDQENSRNWEQVKTDMDWSEVRERELVKLDKKIDGSEKK